MKKGEERNRNGFRQKMRKRNRVMERKSYLCKVKRGNEDERENNFLRKEIEGGV